MKKNTDYGFSLLHPTSVYLYLTIIAVDEAVGERSGWQAVWNP